MKLILTNKALATLRDMLAAPGWGKSDNVATATKWLYLSSKIVGEILPEIPQVAEDLIPGRNSSPLDIKLYEKAVAIVDEANAPEIELTDKMFEVCQIATKYFIKEGRCPSGKAMNELITHLKLLES